MVFFVICSADFIPPVEIQGIVAVEFLMMHIMMSSRKKPTHVFVSQIISWKKFVSKMTFYIQNQTQNYKDKKHT
jgi:hypothetical protein